MSNRPHISPQMAQIDADKNKVSPQQYALLAAWSYPALPQLLTGEYIEAETESAEMVLESAGNSV